MAIVSPAHNCSKVPLCFTSRSRRPAVRTYKPGLCLANVIWFWKNKEQNVKQAGIPWGSERWRELPVGEGDVQENKPPPSTEWVTLYFPLPLAFMWWSQPLLLPLTDVHLWGLESIMRNKECQKVISNPSSAIIIESNWIFLSKSVSLRWL